MSTDTECWDEKVGPWGATVRVKEDRPGGVVALYWSARNGSGYDREPLDFTVRNGDGTLNEAACARAAEEAQNLSNLLRQGKLPEEVRRAGRAPVTLGKVFDAYRTEELPEKGEDRRRHVRQALACFERFWGRDMVMDGFGRRQWDRFVRLRLSGAIGPRGRPVPPDERTGVGPDAVKSNLKVFRAVCRWATGEDTDPEGGKLLDADPSRGPRLNLPSKPDSNVRRPVCHRPRFEKILEAADDATVRVAHGRKQRAPLGEILTLLWYTGRRGREIVGLRWGDWMPDLDSDPTGEFPGTYRHGGIHFREELSKMDKDQYVPVAPEVRDLLEEMYQERLAGDGVPGPETPIFPAPESEGTLRRRVAFGWFCEAEERAGLVHREQGGLHELRRSWVIRRKHLPVEDVAKLGGWSSKETVLKIYEAPDAENVQAVVMADSAPPVPPAEPQPQEG